MAASASTAEVEREKELFRLLKESLEEKPADVPKNLEFLRRGQQNLDYKQIGIDEGFVNYVYRIQEKPPGSQSVVIKWTRTLMRAAEKEGIDVKLPGSEKLSDHDMCQRNTKEAEAVAKIEKIVPGSTTKIYYVDPKRYFFIMEDLVGYETWREQLVRNVLNADVFRKISEMMATLHKATHIKTLGKEEFGKVSASLYKNPMTEQAAAFWFDIGFKRKNEFMVIQKERPFSERMEKILPELYDNEEISAVLQLVKESFLNMKFCYLHNDTHPGSFMINEESGDVRWLDLEIAGVGNPAKEVGYALGEICMMYYVYLGRDKPELSEELKEVVIMFISDYLARMGDYIDDKGTFMQNLAGHAGHFACMRTANTVLQFPSFVGLEEAEANCLSAVTRLLKNMKDITTMETFISQAFQ